MTQYPMPTTYTTYTAACGHELVYEGGNRSMEQRQAEACGTCELTSARTLNADRMFPLTHTSTGAIIAAIERGVDVEARYAAYNEEELTEEDDW